MNKKNINLAKTKTFLQKYPFIVFLQHNNLTVKDWSELRTSLNTIQENNIFVFKNTIMESVLLSEFLNLDDLNSKKIKFLFQGPSVAIGCVDLNELNTLCNLIDSRKKMIIIGAVYSKNIISHLDLKKLLTLNNSVYHLFLNNFTSQNNLHDILQNSLSLSILKEIPMNLLCFLGILQQKLKK